ncbi:hypothetical protein ES705_22730 [subsurface metagenome]
MNSPRVEVTVNGKPLKHQVYHSPTGFEWGYLGSGPADLALSILWNFLGKEPSRILYMDFKTRFVARWKDKWEITSSEIQSWIDSGDYANFLYAKF